MYGNVQLFFLPLMLIFGINLSLGITSAVIFALGYTSAARPYYVWLHLISLHILPAAWCTVVVLFQLLFVF